MCCHDLEVMSSNPGWIELGMLSTSVLSRTLTQNIFIMQRSEGCEFKSHLDQTWWYNLTFEKKVKLEAFRERRPPWPRLIITLILPTVKMLSLGCEDYPPPKKKKKKKEKRKKKGSGSLPAR